MKSAKSTFCSLLFLLALNLIPAHAERYVCNFSATVTSRGAVGPYRIDYKKADFLNLVANTSGRSLDPNTLQLVYDTTANQFLVVQKADGALVTLVYSVVNQREIGIGDGSLANARILSIRQADLVEPGASAVVGSVGGEVRAFETLDFKPNGVAYTWKAKFSVLSQTGGVFLSPGFSVLGVGNGSQYFATPSLIQGQFSVHGLPFVPSGK